MKEICPKNFDLIMMPYEKWKDPQSDYLFEQDINICTRFNGNPSNNYKNQLSTSVSHT